VACTVTYWISRSLWPPVLLHWSTVLIWITLLGGQGLAGSDGQNPQRTSAELAANVEQFADRLAQSDEFSGVVLLSQHSRPLVRRAFGFADREKQRANTVETPFALASVSKMFTAVVVAQLVEQQKVSLDATIGSLLPGYPAGPAGSQVQVRHLLSMSSGIRTSSSLRSSGQRSIKSESRLTFGAFLHRCRWSSSRARSGPTAIRTFLFLERS
jgi:CubicO group peptidase (beta-lactamase class C family)